MLQIQKLKVLMREHWAILLLSCAAVFPLFADLGGDYLWSDEGDTAVLATSILRTGLPTAWDGTTFTDADFGERLNRDLVMVSHPWLQYYVTAASFLLFGQNEFAARFPFALAGLLTIPLLYVLIVRLTQDKRAGISAASLLMLSVQFLLYSRQCRNYSLNMFLACLLIWLLLRLTSWRTCLAFCLCAIALFHCSPSGLAPLSALGMATLIHRPLLIQRRWFWRALPMVAAATIPWIFVARAGYQQNTYVLENWTLLPARLTQFLIECASITPVIGVVVLFIWVWAREYRNQKNRITRQKPASMWKLCNRVSGNLMSNGEQTYFVLAGLVILAYAGLVCLTQSRMDMFNYGLRYATAIIPLTMGMIGILISKASRSNTKLWLALLIILAVTKLGRITPWTFVDEERAWFDRSVFSAMHVPKGWAGKIFRTALVSFARELWHENRGTVAQICEFLKANAAPGDILITNYGWEPIYFHTRLPQGLKVMPHWPIYSTARQHQLPEYVFSVQSARWFIWRKAWEGYRDYYARDIERALVESGATLTHVATLHESTWENRPELHFHRYPGKDYKFPWFADEEKREAYIFRIDWPERGKSAAAPPSN